MQHQLDLRHLAAPALIAVVMDALDHLPDDDSLRVRLPWFPAPLLGMLAMLDFDHSGGWLEGGGFELHIWRRDSLAAAEQARLPGDRGGRA